MDPFLAIIQSEINDRSHISHVATGPPTSSTTPTSLPAPIPTAAPHGELLMHVLPCHHTVPYYPPPCSYFVMVTIIPDLNSHCLVESHLSHALHHCISCVPVMCDILCMSVSLFCFISARVCKGGRYRFLAYR